MTNTARIISTFGLVGGLLVATLPAHSQEEADPETEEIRAAIRAANREIREFRSAGGETGAPEDPVHRWSAKLWRYGRENVGSKAASLAAAEGVHLLVHADRIDEAVELARGLPLNDPSWPQVINFVAEGARLSSDYDYFVAQAEALLAAWTDPAASARLRFSLAEAFWQRGSDERAIAEFRLVAEQATDPEMIASARGNVYEIENLGLGQEAPVFVAETRAGDELALAELRGDPTLIIFWASW